MRLIAGIYTDQDDAKKGIAELVEDHFEPEEINVLVSDRGERRRVPVEDVGHAGRAGAIGGVLGAVLGGLGATLLSTGVLALPGLGLIGVGPAIAALEGAFLGGATVGTASLILGLELDEVEADLHAEHIERGGIWVGVYSSGERADHAHRALQETGAAHVIDRAAQPPQEARTG